MNSNRQVDKSHYDFLRYMNKARWNSVWHQLDEVIRLAPENVLEIGLGTGVFKQVASLFGLKVETLDLDPALNPDHVGSVEEIPLSDASFDIVCAFQILEHVPYESSLRGFNEMIRVSKQYIVISLPDARPVWSYQVHIPGFGMKNILLQRPQFNMPENKFDGEHYWELNKKGFELSRVVSDLTRLAKLVKTYRVVGNTYHRFFVFSKYTDPKLY